MSLRVLHGGRPAPTLHRTPEQSSELTAAIEYERAVVASVAEGRVGFWNVDMWRFRDDGSVVDGVYSFIAGEGRGWLWVWDRVGGAVAVAR